MLSKKQKELLLKEYGTTKPADIKLKIIWLHLQALMSAQYPTDKPGTESHATMQRYKLHWQWCEK